MRTDNSRNEPAERAEEETIFLGDLYLEHRESMIRQACYWMHDPAAAEDAVHAVFVKLLKMTGDKTTVRFSRAYLGVALRRQCFNGAQRRDSRIACCGQISAAMMPATHPTRHVAVEDRVDWLRRSLDRLPPQPARVLALHLQGYSYNEIAEILGIAANTVNAHLQRAKALLRKRHERERERERRVKPGKCSRLCEQRGSW